MHFVLLVFSNRDFLLFCAELAFSAVLITQFLFARHLFYVNIFFS
jgi:hypothetical protein